MNKKIGRALVVGAGISGIRAALDMAETGYGVTLIDRSPNLGGILSRLDYQFPTNHCGMCKMLPLVERDAGSQYCLRKGLFHENIDIMLSTEMVHMDGEPGNFTATLRQQPQFIDPEKCIGCGACVPVCPVEVPDAFNEGLSKRKAIYLPVPHAIPNPYVIDAAACTRCGDCVSACPTDAIRLYQKERREFRILVVDDELIVRDSLKEWLGEEGFSTAMAGSGEAALEQLTEQTFHLMLLDIKMPGMDGVEVLKKAKEILPDIAVVMMTAYATVETAVEAMKIGALDYLVKPFDPETLVAKVVDVFETESASKGKQLEIGAVVLCGGTDYFDPASGKDTFGYGLYPDVVTSLEFERILSGTGPCGGRLVRPSDGKPIQKIAWIQCVGSRDLQADADYCSGICCMFAIKEALLAKEKADHDLEAVIYYMDMRTFGKSFQRYRDRAETEFNVRFERGRIHSVVPDNKTGDLTLANVDSKGRRRDEHFDLVVLSVGQRPAAGTTRLSEMIDLPLNPWGFGLPKPFSSSRTEREGILLGGSYTGLRDIGESVIEAGAASLNASRVIHAGGGGLAPEPGPEPELKDVSRETPQILVAVCTCGKTLSKFLDPDRLTRRLKNDPAVKAVIFLDRTCTAEGWNDLVAQVSLHRFNRLLIGACLPYVYGRKIKALGEAVGLGPALIEVVDIGTPAFSAGKDGADISGKTMARALGMGISTLRYTNPAPVSTVPVTQKALVIGGGIAGMAAALSIADHGYPVDLVEKGEHLGGNLRWLQRTVNGNSPQALLEENRQRIEKHPLIRTHTETRVVGAFGQVGGFYTTIEGADAGSQTLEHGVTILATGGTEAATTEYGYGQSSAIVTHKELEQRIAENGLDPGALETVVMIQCVGSRQAPRNYCSRVCCSSALKHALYLKEKNPEIAIYILYRDMMTYGFNEKYFTEARKAEIIFIPYDLDKKPEVRLAQASGKPLQVRTLEPILGVEVDIDADLLVLATGIVPDFPEELAGLYGAERDVDGFFQEAESKWRPVDALKEGVFGCGLTHSPRSITETISTAEAAAQRSMRILSRPSLASGKIVAQVRHSLCSLCEQCIPVCPYGARLLDIDLKKVLVNPAMCQGCGSCAAVCPNSASILEGYSDGQMMDTIDAALEGF